jgi:hypothetical protein
VTDPVSRTVPPEMGRSREWLAVLGVGFLGLFLAALIVLAPWHPASLLHPSSAPHGTERVVDIVSPGQPGRVTPLSTAPSADPRNGVRSEPTAEPAGDPR